MEQQTEKLTALGKLAANLAHELNNPASAAQRAAGGLLDELRVYGHEKYKLGALCMEDDKLKKVREWQDSIGVVARRAAGNGWLRFARQEDRISAWLAAHGVENAWKIAPELAETGMCADHLEPLGELLDPKATTVVLSQFASSLRAERMTEAMIDSTARIFDLIKAIKDYSYMDQAPIQETDIPKGLDTTLTMLQSRLGAVEVVREYEPGLPCISAYASELNQVWTALIENALDAIQDRAALSSGQGLRATCCWSRSGTTGPASPRDTGPRLRAVLHDQAARRGLGLGLDVVMRIVMKHRGFVQLQSAPGAACFQVRLPLQQLQAY